MVIRTLLTLVLSSALSVATAHAQNAQQARALFEQGLSAADAQRWEQAADLFRQSRAIVDRPSTAYNLAVALEHLGRAREALESLADYFRMSNAEESRYARATALRAELDARVARVVLTVTPDTARVEVDGALREGTGAQRELVLDEGDHVFTISAEGLAPQTVRLSLARGTRTAREVALVAATGEPEPEPEPEPPPIAPAPSGGGVGALGIVGLTLAGVGLGAGVVSLATGLVSNGIHEELTTECPNGLCPDDTYRARIDEGFTMALVSTVTFAVALAAGVAGVVLFAADITSGGGASDRARLELELRPAGLGVRVRL
jgi:hypothetical protein